MQDFSGRAGRREFWPFAMTVLFIVLVTSVVLPPLGTLVGCLLFLPLSSCAVRRLHDIGRSGAWLIPLIAIPACMIVLFAIGLSILGVLLVATLGIKTSPSQYEDGIRAIETALTWTFAVYLALMMVMLSLTGSQASNQFREL